MGLKYLGSISDNKDVATKEYVDGAYTSKAAESGGADLSLVTTGEKYLWNSAASGGVTDVEVDGTSVVSGGVASIDLTGKQDALVSGTNIKTVNNESLLGSGNVSLLDFFYPIGSYYETSDSTFDPNTAWGGTWSLEAEGQVHISAGTNYTIGGTGGNTSLTPTFTGTQVTLTHSGGKVSDTTLDINKIPSHSHKYHDYLQAQGSSSATYKTAMVSGGNQTYGTVAAGGSKAHGHGFTQPNSHTYTPSGTISAVSTMQPYIVVNRWHRTA